MSHISVVRLLVTGLTHGNPEDQCSFVPLFKITNIDSAKCILHFPVSDTLFDNEGMCYITVLLGLLDQSPSNTAS